jgi:lipid II:glycine glycyltransferase (peptidoglycan interpeptide bridge formation enzyme)
VVVFTVVSDFNSDADVLRTQTNPHFMQSDAWASFKSTSPWTGGELSSPASPVTARTYRRNVDEFGTLVHLPRVSGLTPSNVAAFTSAVHGIAGDSFAVKLESYQPRDEELLDALLSAGWIGARSTQYRFGVTAELRPDPDEAFMLIKKRARNEVRQADARGITVRRVDPTAEVHDQLLAMIDAMQDRSGSFVRSDDYLRACWDEFTSRNQGSFYVAEFDGSVVAGAFVIEYGSNAFYKDGGSFRVESGLPVGRALQWHIIKDLGQRGFERYDLGNVPNPAEESATMSGLLTFKSGFAKEIIEYMPALELPLGSRADEWRAIEPQFVTEFKSHTGDSFY